MNCANFLYIGKITFTIFTGECFGSYMFEKTANKVAHGGVKHVTHKTLVDCQVGGLAITIPPFWSVLLE